MLEYGFSLTRVFQYKERIVENFFLIRENLGERKPAFWHILCNETEGNSKGSKFIQNIKMQANILGITKQVPISFVHFIRFVLCCCIFIVNRPPASFGKTVIQHDFHVQLCYMIIYGIYDVSIG